jgi:hypothetical protein
MIRKIAACAVIALLPGFALAAGASTNVPVPADNHAVSTDAKPSAAVKTTDTAVKADAVVKTDATAKDGAVVKTNAAVKTDASAKSGKTVRHRVNKTDDKSKAGSTSDSKDSPKL